MTADDTCEFETIIRNSDYIVRDHLVHDVRIMPGVVFFDIVCRILQSQAVSLEEVELRNIFFNEALSTTDEFDRSIRIALEPPEKNSSAKAAITVQSRPVKGNRIISPHWAENFRCDLHLGNSPLSGKIDIAALKKAASITTDLDKAYARIRGMNIRHLEFMKPAGTLFKAGEDTLAEISLSPLARKSRDPFFIHPVFLDAATIIAFSVLETPTNGNKPFIPLYVKSFRAISPLQEKCFVHVRGSAQMVRAQDIVHMSMALYKADGTIAASIGGMASKRIRHRNLIGRLTKTPPGHKEKTIDLQPSARTAASNAKDPIDAGPEKHVRDTDPHGVRDVEPEKAAAAELRRIVARFCNIDPDEVSSDKSFYEQGLDSNHLLQIVKHLEARMEKKLYPTLLFEYPNIRELSTHLLEAYGDRFSDSKGFESEIKGPLTVTPEYRLEAHRSKRTGLERKPLDIAIIGLGGRYPMAPDLDDFWDNLSKGRDCITEIPVSRWNNSDFYDKNKERPGWTYSKWGGFLDDVDRFDPLFFNISPREAAWIDPQERLFLEIVWETLEDAGYTRAQLDGGRIGVFVGLMWADYQLIGRRLKGNVSFASVANRVSYFFNFHGPSIALDSMCSSSLTAIHLACRSIREGESEMAIAGGVNVALHPKKYIQLSQAQFLSSDGRCRSFGQDGDGYTPGEGVGAIMMKPLERAVTDGDQIHAVLKASALNHGGRANAYTVPNPQAQGILIAEALAQADIDPRTISYVEAHGTGTALGDPIEIAGLQNAFEKSGFEETRQFCAVGSVKSNIGHLESAAGIAGLTKVLLQMKNKQIVPSIHSDPPNHHIDFRDSPFFVQQKLSEWKPPQLWKDGISEHCPRRAGISAFGAGGANAHIILEEWPQATKSRVKTRTGAAQIILLSARSKKRLRASAMRMSDFIKRKCGLINPEQPSPVLNDPPKSLQRDLQRIAANILHVDEQVIDPTEDLDQYGMDRIKFRRFAQELGTALGLPVAPEMFADHRSIILICRCLHGLYPHRPPEESIPENARKGIKPPEAISLADIAYTLQVGREAMAERLAMIVTNLDDLMKGLDRYASGATEIVGLFSGNADQDRHRAETMLGSDSQDTFIRRLLDNNDLSSLAQYWALGADVDWRCLYPQAVPCRVSLPTYPFVKKRCWIPAVYLKASETKSGARLHPLLGRNTSTLQVQKYATQLAADEFYLSDHKVAGQMTMPGVACIEMARAAGEIAGAGEIRDIRNIVWLQPIKVDEKPREIQICLYPTPAGIDYEIGSSETADKMAVYARGSVIIAPNESHPSSSSERIDTEGVKNRCRESCSKADFYRFLGTNGLNYGKGFQTICEVFFNSDEALSRLRLPEHLQGGFESFGLHPSLMDGALQTVAVLLPDTDGKRIFLPFSIGKLEIIRPLSKVCQVYARCIDPQANDLKTFSVQLLDTSGEVLVRISDFSMRIKNDSTRTVQDDFSTTLYLTQEWVVCKEEAIFEEQLGSVIIFDSGDALGRMLKQRMAARTPVVQIKPGEAFEDKDNNMYVIRPTCREDYDEVLRRLGSRKISPERIIYNANQFMDPTRHIYALICLSQALMAQNPRQTVCMALIYGQNEDEMRINAGNAAIGAFAKTLCLENPKFTCKTIIFNQLAETETVMEKILRECQSGSPVQEVRYDEGPRKIKQLKELNPDRWDAKLSAIENGDIYLITGGLGGIGLILAEYLVRRWQAKPILSGRSKPDLRQKKRISMLSDSGTAEDIYIQADISNMDQTRALIAEIKERFGRLDGIIHCAGAVRDALISNKTNEEIAAVLAPKVNGTINLDLATAKEPLKFFIFFSSISAVMGNIGQSDYSYANSFMDRYARLREQMRDKGKRSGSSISVNWPLWAEGGMRVDDHTLQSMAQNWGVAPLPTKDGLKAFEIAIANNIRQLILVHGDSDKLRQVMGVKKQMNDTKSSSGDRKSETEKPGEELAEIEKKLARMIVDILELDESDAVGIENIPNDENPDADENPIVLTESLNAYGFDSIMYSKLANKIDSAFGVTTTPALFSGNPTVKYLAQQILEMDPPGADHHSESSMGLTGKKQTNAEWLQTRNRQFIDRFPDAADLKDRFVESEGHGAGAFNPIAIIGIGGLMPGSDDLETFWRHLVDEKELIGDFPQDRRSCRNARPCPVAFVKRGGFMNRVDAFDAAFFRISPAEAKWMDPQQRLFLQTVWKTIENAGYKASDLSGAKVGVFVGVSSADYFELSREMKIHPDGLLVTGVAHSIIANRISSQLNFTGPSEAVDTACSSACVAVHRAITALHLGECDLAVAGGVNLLLTDSKFTMFNDLGLLSPDGKVRTFDQQANGYVRGEGVGAILLKPLHAAERDGDHIHAVIRASAVNHCGRGKSLTAPNAAAQAEAIASAYEQAGISPATVGFVECQGTATAAGDPVEVEALKRAFVKILQKGKSRSAGIQYCGLGSVKPNVGHLESASGMASIIKVILALKNRKLPATINFKTLNPQIELEKSPFYIVDKTVAWDPPKNAQGTAIPRRAAINAYGFGGSNAHIILEEYCFCGQGNARGEMTAADSKYDQSEAAPGLFVYSSRTRESLMALLSATQKALAADPDIDFKDMAYTLREGREAMQYRVAIIAADKNELADEIDKVLKGRSSLNVFQSVAPKGKPETDYLPQTETPDKIADKVVRNGDLAHLAEHWVCGGGVDWSLLPQNKGCRRIPLPTYCFATKRFWLPEPKESMDSGIMKNSTENRRIERNLESEPIERIAAGIKKWVAALLLKPYEQIDAKAPLAAYGFNSLTGLRLNNRIKEFYNVPLSIKELFNCNTIHDIAQCIVKAKEQHNAQNALVQAPAFESEATGPLKPDACRGIEQKSRRLIRESFFEAVLQDLRNGQITTEEALKIESQLELEA